MLRDKEDPGYLALSIVLVVVFIVWALLTLFELLYLGSKTAFVYCIETIKKAFSYALGVFGYFGNGGSQ